MRSFLTLLIWLLIGAPAFAVCPSTITDCPSPTYNAPTVNTLGVVGNETVGGTLGVTGAATFSGGLTGALTGHASLDLPLTGGTLTGLITVPQLSFGTTSPVWSGSALTQSPIYAVSTWTGTSTVNTGGVYTPLGFYFNVTDEVSAAADGTAVGYINTAIDTGHQGSAAVLALQLSVNSALTGTTGEYFAFASATSINANVGGTSSSPSGNAYAINSSLSNSSAGTYLEMMSIYEMAIQLQAPPHRKYGIWIAQRNNDTSQGTETDTAIGLWNFGAIGSGSGNSIGWQTGVSFGDVREHFNITTTGTLLKSFTGTISGDPAPTVASLIDFSSIGTVTAYDIRMPNYSVTGAGVSSQSGSGTFGTAATNGLTLSGSSGAGQIVATGSTANINLVPSNGGNVVAQTSNGSPLAVFKDVANGNGVTYIILENAASGPPTITTMGGTNTGLNINGNGGTVAVEAPLSVGIGGNVVGSIVVFNATAGSLITVSPPTGSLGSVALTWPGASGTLALTNASQTISATQTYSGTLNVTGTLQASGTPGLASKTCTINTANAATGITLTITGGIITGTTTC